MWAVFTPSWYVRAANGFVHAKKGGCARGAGRGGWVGGGGRSRACHCTMGCAASLSCPTDPPSPLPASAKLAQAPPRPPADPPRRRLLSVATCRTWTPSGPRATGGRSSPTPPCESFPACRAVTRDRPFRFRVGCLPSRHSPLLAWTPSRSPLP